MCANTLIAQIIADKGKLLLYSPCSQGKHQLIAAYAVAQADSINNMGIGIHQQGSLYDRRGDSRIARRQRPHPTNAPGRIRKTDFILPGRS